MPQAWRLVAERRAATAFTGEGSVREPGRWHKAGTRCVYVAGSLSLAALEVMVHSGGGRPTRPYVSFELDIPDDLLIDDVPARLLSDGWRSSPPRLELQEFGSDWARSLNSAVLRVPSAVNPRESNYLLNPAHTRFSSLTIHPPEAFEFDERLLVGIVQ